MLPGLYCCSQLPADAVHRWPQAQAHSNAAVGCVLKPTPSRRLVFDADNRPTEIKRQQSEGDNDRTAKKNKGGRKERRKKGREGRGGLHQLFGKNAQEVTFFSPLLWPDLCCTLFFFPLSHASVKMSNVRRPAQRTTRKKFKVVAT